MILVSDVDEIFSPKTLTAIDRKSLCTTIHQIFITISLIFRFITLMERPENAK